MIAFPLLSNWFCQSHSLHFTEFKTLSGSVLLTAFCIKRKPQRRYI